MKIINKIMLIDAIIVISYILLTILISIIILIYIDDSHIYDYYKLTCLNLNNATTEPRLIIYSGCNCNGFTSCENCHKSGVFCILENGTEVDLTIREALN